LSSNIYLFVNLFSENIRSSSVKWNGMHVVFTSSQLVPVKHNNDV